MVPIVLNVKIKPLSSNINIPAYATVGSAGMDLTANISEPLLLAPNEKCIIPTGIALQIPFGYAGFIFARSGLAVKHGIALSNGVGVIDSDYIGEIKVGLINLSNQQYSITPQERIAQLVFQPIEIAQLSVCSELKNTSRGEGGFGSTGRT